MTYAQLVALIDAENELHGPAQGGTTQRVPERGDGRDLMAFAELAAAR